MRQVVTGRVPKVEHIEGDMAKEDFPEVTWTELLTETPPGKVRRVDKTSLLARKLGDPCLAEPEIWLWCDRCESLILFESVLRYPLRVPDNEDPKGFMEYCCKQCEKERKSYVVLASRDQGPPERWIAVKIGEWPPFGPHVPERLLKLLGSDAGLFRQGMRAESEGFGIGAVAYYRRVVENQKDRLFEEIIRVAKKEKCGQDRIRELEQAKGNFQFKRGVQDFSKAIEAMPESLLIERHNPMLLLHRVLSEDLHGENDDHCLASATDIRVVLAAMADKIGHVLKENAELDEAVKRLIKSKRKD